MAVFGGSGVEIQRLDLSWYPFTAVLEHGLCEGIFNRKGEFVDMTVHLWQDVPGGCVHMDASVAAPNVSEPPAFILEMLAQSPNCAIVPPSSTDHGEYEASRWPQFLPALYALWKDHPDPSQSVPCDLRIRQDGEHFPISARTHRSPFPQNNAQITRRKPYPAFSLFYKENPETKRSRGNGARGGT